GAVDSRRAVDAPALAVHGADPVDQDRALPVPLTAGPPAPGVEAAARHAEDAAQLADSEFAGLLHEPELHFRSFAKYAKAFFKMSRSWVTSRSFCSSSRTRRACGARRPRPGNASVGVSVSCSRHRCSRLRAIPRCVATSVNDFPSSTTRWTASFLNCGVKVRRTRIVRLPMDHLVRASHGSYLGVHFSGELQTDHTEVMLVEAPGSEESEVYLRVTDITTGSYVQAPLTADDLDIVAHILQHHAARLRRLAERR